MTVSTHTVEAFKSYQIQAQVLVRNYLLADTSIPYTSVLGGIFACKVVYDLSQLVSTFYFRSYNTLSKIQKIEWNNRAMSTLHSILIATVSTYFVFWSDLFSDNKHAGLITFRSSPLSIVSLGASVGYFLVDLGMLFWMYPSLGGSEYVIHHSLSAISVAYSMLTGEGQLYTFMVLISELTTPEINMRWYLDVAGLKRSNAYLVNGVLIFFAWLVARILLFLYMFSHVYMHYNQVSQMHAFGRFLVFVVPAVLAAMNLVWFGKILKGLKKTLTKWQ
ncbi:TLC domain-containing protein 4-B-like [Impatiens glandulifera]|uniref:TLC domain-containing protein 4-B-like n=1 Tax=Impatiens glandulifera TaxID=253017 RepID=UPI001FB17ECD|nr:TLC domain-containing protein 4-B-like [Impatiens glandulifera]XP_047316011.1 TLC domain-containing protein 4-B-like [Impatiens glandulifera]